ncbi:MAG: phage holin family protein [Thermoleophilaceae bacterium]|nr:phage holin family protein [Thermoleophilaceae bacterium]
MTDGNGVRPPGSAEKTVGEMVQEVSEKASLLVREEIELAKAEIEQKAKTLGKGVVIGAVAGVFVSLAVVYLLHGFAYFLQDLLNTEVWVGYLIVTVLLLISGAVAGLLARKAFQTGPPTPDLAIEEAKRTRDLIEEEAHR